MAFTYVTVTHTFETAADLAAGGEVEFAPVTPMHNGVTVVKKTVAATLNGAGAMSQLLAANTDPDTLPTGTVYQVTERITGQTAFTYYVQVPHDAGTTIDLRSLAGWVGATGTGGTVSTINGEPPDGTGNVVLSATDVGAQPADGDLTGLAGLGDGVPRRASGTWALVTGTPDGTKFLRDDGTWAVASGGGSYTDEQVRDVIGTALVAGPNVTITPNDAADTITITAATSGASGIPASTVDAKGDLIVGTADDTVARRSVGTDGQALLADSAQATGVAWGTPTPADSSVTNAKVATGAAISADKLADGTTNKVMTAAERTKVSNAVDVTTINAKGDLIVGTANDAINRLAVGTNGLVLKANSATSTGVEWALDNTASNVGTGVHPVTGMIHAAGYGVVGDGTTDNYTALTNALAAATSGTGGLTVLLPQGRIRFVIPSGGGLVLGNAHLLGCGGAANWSKTTPSTDYGTTLAPVSSTANLAALKTTVGQQQASIRNLAIDMIGMADGSVNSAFTASQTKGIYVTGTFHMILENIYIKHVPSNACAIYVDHGGGLGQFWGYMRGVFIERWTKKGVANGYTTEIDPNTVPTAAKDQSARGIVMVGGSPTVTAWTIVDSTNYRGMHLQNVDELCCIQYHAENNPEDGVVIDGGGRHRFLGGFFEHQGTEDPSGVTSSYLLFRGVNAPVMLSVHGSLSGNGLDYSQWGPGLEVWGDPYGLSGTANYYRQISALIIDRAAQGRFTGMVDIRIRGPYSTSAIATASDTTLIGDKTSTSLTWDAQSKYNATTGVFTFSGDTTDGLTGRYQVHYTIGVRATNATAFANGDWVDIKLVPTGSFFTPAGTMGTLVSRHMLSPGLTSQMLHGTFALNAVAVGSGRTFVIAARASRGSVAPGLADTDTERGYISARQFA